MQEASLPKVLIVIFLLIVANLVLRYFREVRRQAKAYREQRSNKPVISKPRDEQLGEYVDYEEVKD